ncbi:hypothetical protein CC2G_000029 [Coprinopsis cinerea AmutBmut pab1-1]|nr:hypothetical protein CC2G_000029 [Coprinopsis cinerea AmutBmut pab1-1]
MSEPPSADDALSILLNSPFKSRLNTNYAPSPSEIAQINHLLSDPVASLSSLDLEIHDAWAALHVLLVQRQKLKREVDAHRALLTPIRRIPDELLQLVFEHTLPDGHLPVCSTRVPPLVLTLVSREWRKLALRTPRLWNRVHIAIPFAAKEQEEGEGEGLGLGVGHREVTRRVVDGIEQGWVRWAGKLPLEFSLCWPRGAKRHSPLERTFPKMVMEYHTRLSALHLDLPDSLLDYVLRFQGSDLPHLRRVSLHLKVDPGKPARGARAAGGALWTAERLDSVGWYHVDSDVLGLPFRWEQVREVEVEGTGQTPLCFVSVRDARALMDAAPRLERLVLQLAQYEEKRFQRRRPTTLNDDDGEGGDGVGEVGAEGERTTSEAEEQRAEEELMNKTIWMLHLEYLALFDIQWSLEDQDIPRFFSSKLQTPNLKTLVYRSTPLLWEFHEVMLGISREDDPQPARTSDSNPGSTTTVASVGPRKRPPPLHPSASTTNENQNLHRTPLLTFLQTQLEPLRLTSFTIHAESMPSEDALMRCLECMEALRVLEVVGGDRGVGYGFGSLSGGGAFEVERDGDGDGVTGRIVPTDRLLKAFCGVWDAGWSVDSSVAGGGGGLKGKGKGKERERERVLCPNLESLKCAVARFSEGELVRFVRFRTRAWGGGHSEQLIDTRVRDTERLIGERVVRRRLWKIEVGLARCRPLRWSFDSSTRMGRGGDKGRKREVDMAMVVDLWDGGDEVGRDDVVVNPDDAVRDDEVTQHAPPPSRPELAAGLSRSLDAIIQDVDSIIEEDDAKPPPSPMCSIHLQEYLEKEFGIRAVVRYASEPKDGFVPDAKRWKERTWRRDEDGWKERRNGRVWDGAEMEMDVRALAVAQGFPLDGVVQDGSSQGGGGGSQSQAGGVDAGPSNLVGVDAGPSPVVQAGPSAFVDAGAGPSTFVDVDADANIVAHHLGNVEASGVYAYSPLSDPLAGVLISSVPLPGEVVEGGGGGGGNEDEGGVGGGGTSTTEPADGSTNIGQPAGDGTTVEAEDSVEDEEGANVEGSPAVVGGVEGAGTVDGNEGAGPDGGIGATGGHGIALNQDVVDDDDDDDIPPLGMVPVSDSEGVDEDWDGDEGIGLGFGAGAVGSGAGGGNGSGGGGLALGGAGAAAGFGDEVQASSGSGDARGNRGYGMRRRIGEVGGVNAEEGVRVWGLVEFMEDRV